MVTGITDTSVLVDVIRNHPPAVAWLQWQQTLAITPLIYMELVGGAYDRVRQQRAIKMLSDFEMVYLTTEDQQWAMQQVGYILSHGIGMVDCLIASVSHRLQIPLYTRNLKHFTPLLGNLAQMPY
jgi:predicted nucleic acid-binding protein